MAEITTDVRKTVSIDISSGDNTGEVFNEETENFEFSPWFHANLRFEGEDLEANYLEINVGYFEDVAELRKILIEVYDEIGLALSRL